MSTLLLITLHHDQFQGFISNYWQDVDCLYCTHLPCMHVHMSDGIVGTMNQMGLWALLFKEYRPIQFYGICVINVQYKLEHDC